MKNIIIIIAFFIASTSILFSSIIWADDVTQCPDNPATASTTDWVITQPLPTSSGYFSQATIFAGNNVYCHYSPQDGYFGFLYSTFTVNAKSLNPKYWSLKNCHGAGLMCCSASAELCSFNE